MSTTPTCTVVVGAPMVRCGAPAITSFTASTGETFAECAIHATPVDRHRASVDPVFVVGASVVVPHCGISKVGEIVAVGPVNIKVRVPIHVGKPTAATKVITVTRDAVA